MKFFLKPIDWIIKKLNSGVVGSSDIDTSNYDSEQIKIHIEQRLKYRDKVLDLALETFHSYDRFLITIASTAMAVSLTFTKNLVPFETAIWVGAFISSLLCFILVILLCLANLLKSGFHNRKLHTELCSNIDFTHKDNDSIMRVNVLMGILLVLGFSFMSVYVIRNVYNSRELIKSEKTSKLKDNTNDTDMSNDIEKNRPTTEQLERINDSSLIQKSMVPSSPINTAGTMLNPTPQDTKIPTPEARPSSDSPTNANE